MRLLKDKTHFSFRNLSILKQSTYSFFLLLTVAILASSIVLYLVTRSKLEQEIAKAKIEMLEKAADALLRKMDGTIIICLELWNDENIYKARKFNDIDSLREDINSVRFTGTVLNQKDIEQQILKTLNRHAIVSKFIHSIYLYIDNGNKVYTSLGQINQIDTFKDRSLLNLIHQRSQSFFLIENPDMAYKDTPTDFIISVGFRSYYNDIFAINLSLNDLSGALTGTIGQNDILLVYNDTGKCLITHNLYSWDSNASLPYLDLNNVSPGQSGYSVKRNMTTRMLISHYTSNMGWEFVLYSPYAVVSGSLKMIKITMILSIVTIIILITLLYYRVAKSIYTPITILAKRVQDAHIAGSDSNRTNNEISLLDNSFTRVLSENQHLRAAIQENIPVYRDSFFRSLLDKYIEHQDEIDSRMKFLGFSFNRTGFITATIDIDDYKTFLNECSEENKYLWKLICRDIIKRMFNRYLAFVTEIFLERIVFVLNIDAGDKFLFNIIEKCNAVKEAIYKETGIPVSIGLGSLYQGHSGISRSFQESIESLQFKLIFGASQVIYIEDTKITKESYYKFPYEKAANLYGFIKIGDYDNSLSVLNEIVSELTDIKHMLTYRIIQQVFIQIVGGIMNTLSESGFDITELSSCGEDVFGKLLNLRTKKEIFTWFKDYLRVLTDFTASSLRDRKEQYVIKAIEYINTGYINDISLEMVAEHIGITHTYLSTLFKGHTGRSFVAFLRDVRIARAKELLTNSDMSVNEVTKSVGYANNYYFIKIFKKYVGITPGKYSEEMHLNIKH